MSEQGKEAEDTIMILRVSSKKTISVEDVNLPNDLILLEVLISVKRALGAYISKICYDRLIKNDKTEEAGGSGRI